MNRYLGASQAAEQWPTQAPVYAASPYSKEDSMALDPEDDVKGKGKGRVTEPKPQPTPKAPKACTPVVFGDAFVSGCAFGLQVSQEPKQWGLDSGAINDQRGRRHFTLEGYSGFVWQILDAAKSPVLGIEKVEWVFRSAFNLYLGTDRRVTVVKKVVPYPHKFWYRVHVLDAPYPTVGAPTNVKRMRPTLNLRGDALRVMLYMGDPDRGGLPVACARRPKVGRKPDLQKWEIAVNAGVDVVLALGVIMAHSLELQLLNCSHYLAQMSVQPNARARPELNKTLSCLPLAQNAEEMQEASGSSPQTENPLPKGLCPSSSSTSSSSSSNSSSSGSGSSTHCADLQAQDQQVDAGAGPAEASSSGGGECQLPGELQPEGAHVEDEASPAEHKHVEAPASPSEDKHVEAPASPAEDKHVEAPASPAEDKHVEAPASPAEDKHFEDEASPAEDKHVEAPASPAEDKHVEDEASPAEDEHVEWATRPAEDVHVEGATRPAEDVHVGAAASPAESSSSSQRVEECPAGINVEVEVGA